MLLSVANKSLNSAHYKRDRESESESEIFILELPPKFAFKKHKFLSNIPTLSTVSNISVNNKPKRNTKRVSNLPVRRSLRIQQQKATKERNVVAASALESETISETQSQSELEQTVTETVTETQLETISQTETTATEKVTEIESELFVEINSVESVNPNHIKTGKSKEKINWNEWVAATDTKNYLMDDGFLDLLSSKNNKSIMNDKDYSKEIAKTFNQNNNGFLSKLLEQGNVFEKEIVNNLKNMYPNLTVTITGHSRSDLAYQKTLDNIKKGIPFIFSANLRNYKTKTYGVADIIVRSDYINTFLKCNALHQDEIYKHKRDKNNKNKNKYYYVVIDVKYKILQLRSDGFHLRNDGNLKAYKGQVYVYTSALAEMQKYMPKCGFLLGTKYKYTSQNKERKGKGAFDKLGRIDFSDLDSDYITKISLALEWLNTVKTTEYDLSKYPLPRDELYPNMCNHYDFPYHELKKKYAEKHDDLTLLWNVGPKQRRIANNNGIYKWSDKDCKAELLGFKKDKKRTNTINRILEANQSDSIIVPNKLIKNTLDWKSNKTFECFVDFETSCSIFNDITEVNVMNGNNYIFLIGLGYMCPETNLWNYKSFLAESISKQGELNICKSFCIFLKDLQNKYGECVLWHYSQAEVTAWNHMLSNTNLKFNSLLWKDLLKIFLEEPIGIKGALNYSLKSIAKALHSEGCIESDYTSLDGCNNGMDAALQAYKTYNECQKNKISVETHETMKDIITYNEIDVKVMWEILCFLRLHQ